MRNAKVIFILLGSIFWLAFELDAQNVEQRKRIVKTYKVTNDATVDISNKYGDVDVRTWDKDSVRLEIRLVGKAKNDDKLDRLMSIIKFRFANNESYVRATTIVGSSANDLFSELTNLTNAIFTIGSEAKIDYKIFVPEKASLKIDNSFGDIYMDDFYSDLYIKLAHGDFRADHLMEPFQLDLNFGKAFISEANEVKFNLFYAQIDLPTANEVKLYSKTSELDLGEVNKLSIDSRRDEINIGSCKQISGISNFSKIYIDEFKSVADVTLSFGSFNLERINKKFDHIMINSKYTDMTLVFASGSGYQLLLTHTELDFKYPENLAKLEEKVVDAEEEKVQVKGVIGKINESNSNVQIEAEKGELKIFHR